MLVDDICVFCDCSLFIMFVFRSVFVSLRVGCLVYLRLCLVFWAIMLLWLMVWNLLLGVSFCGCVLCYCWLLHCCLWVVGCLTLFKLFSLPDCWFGVVGFFVVVLGVVSYRFIVFAFAGLVVACLGFAVSLWVFGLLLLLLCLICW